MSNDQKTSSPNLGVLKNKLFEEFEKMSQMLQEEKSNFEEQMARRKNELDSEVKTKLAAMAAGNKELDNAKSQLQKKEADFAKEIEKKTLALKRMKEELELDKKAFFKKIEEEQGIAKSKEVEKLEDVEARSQALEKGNKELLLRKLTLESELKNLKQTYKKEEDLHFQKMVALKNELEEIESEIEQKLFFTADQENPNYTKKTRQLIITTVTGDTYRGNINIASKERLSDMFTKVKIPFIVMYDVNFKGEEKATVIINKQNIVSIRPLD